MFHTVISLSRWLIYFEYIKLSKKKLLFIFQSILKSLDLTNPCYIEQNISVPSEFVKTRIHCIGNKVIVMIYQVNNCAENIENFDFVLISNS